MRGAVWAFVLAACHSGAPAKTSAPCDPQFPIPVSESGPDPDGGSYKRGLAFADFNGDGVLDVAVANGGDSVSVLKGLGLRRFDAPVVYTTGQYTTRIAAGDLDGDGDADLVVAAMDYSSSNGTVRVLTNDGHGAFTVGAAYTTAFNLGLALGDLDGDGKLDIVVGNRTSNLVSVFYNAGGGTFGARMDYPSGGQDGYDTATPQLADLDHDGALDLVTTANDGEVAIMLRRGSGYATTAVPLSSDTLISMTFEIGDFDHDGDTDVAAIYDTEPSANVTTPFAGIVRNDGTGAFTALPATPLPAMATLDAAGDLDGDGIPELVAESFPPNDADSLFSLRVDAAGAVTTGWMWNTPTTDFLVLVDLDGDGHLDVAYSDGAGVASLAGRGDGTVVVPETVPTGPSAYSIQRIADVDHDGKLDVLRGSQAGIEVYRNLGGHLGSAATYALAEPSDFTVTDVNGDGQLDLVATSGTGSAGSFQVMLGASGAFAAPTSFPTDVNSQHLAVGDVDGDGKPDVVVACAGYAPREMPPTPGGLDVFHNAGNGTFTLVTRLDGMYSSAIALGDVDGDGRLDVILDGFPTSSVLHGNGDGTFVAPVALGARLAQLIDLNNDGRPDELLEVEGAAVGLGTLEVALARADGTFEDPIPGPQQPLMAAGDIDGDGSPDLVTLQSGLRIWHGNGDGTFAERGRFVGGAPVQIGDLDGDGLGDLVSSGFGPPNVQVQYARCAP